MFFNDSVLRNKTLHLNKDISGQFFIYVDQPLIPRIESAESVDAVLYLYI